MVFEENGCAELWPEKWGVSLERSGRQNQQFYTLRKNTVYVFAHYIYKYKNKQIHTHTPIEKLSASLERFRRQNPILLAIIILSRAVLYYTSQHFICWDFVGMTIQDPQIVGMDPNCHHPKPRPTN